MAEKLSDLSGEKRTKRIAELKRRMQESAMRNRTSENEEEPAPSEAAPAA
jgi:hypothetical protein